MIYKYYCNLPEDYEDKDILCKDITKKGFCEMEFHGCPYQRENIFNLT